jgi:hypothetical protein
MRTPRWWFAGVAALAVASALFWPLPAAISRSDAIEVRLSIALISLAVCAAMALAPISAGRLARAGSIACAVVAIGILALHFAAVGDCVANYDGKPVVIGREYSIEGAAYVKNNPGMTAADLLLDAGGRTEAIWTQPSIRSCRWRLSWGGLADIPLWAAAICGFIAPGSRRWLSAGAATTKRTARAEWDNVSPLYDVFISYRHVEPDRTRALELVQDLESRNLRAAIDVRDFGPNEHFLTEMERCIRQSRFVLCLISAAYVESEHCSEEAVISKTMDLADRRKRLVPLIFEQIELPVWLHGLSGIDCTGRAVVDPIERLSDLLAPKPESPHVS